jgi:hypothetical protein
MLGMLQPELQLLRGYRLSPNCELELWPLADGGVNSCGHTSGAEL